MAIVGSAEIVVRAITNKVRDDIVRGLKDAQPAIASEGQNAGKSFSDSFNKSVNDNMGKGLKDSLKGSDFDKAASDAGDRGGRSLASGFARSAEQGLSGELGKVGSDVGNEAERVMSSAGNRGGSGFNRGFLASGFAKSAMAASKELTSLIAVGNIGGTAIGTLASALSSVVSGLFAMGSAASQAAGALAVLPGMMSVLIQAAGTLKLAFSGVGTALTAGLRAATATTSGSAQAAISNARSIADARTALSRAYQSASQAMASADQQVATASQGVADAERGVAAAQRTTLAAQQALNIAREEGVKELRDLAFQAEDAGLAEQQAALDLTAARAKLQEVQSLPPDDATRLAAELAFKQADLNYREAKARNQDLTAEEKKAAKAGVDGTNAVVAAKSQITDAQKSQITAEKSLASAQKSLASAEASRQQTAIKNAQAISDAQLRLSRAIQDQGSALSAASSQANTYATALARLSPPAQEFVKHLVAMKPAFDKLKSAAGSELFPKLTSAIDLLAKGAFPVLQTQLATTGRLVGEIALQFARTISTGEGLSLFQKILEGNNKILDVFTNKTKTGRSAVGNLVLIFLRMLHVIQPLTHRFAIWIRDLSVGGVQATNTAKKMQHFHDFLHKAGDTAAQLGDIFHNLWKAIRILGSAATPAGQSLLDSFQKATHHLDRFLKKLRDNGTLKKFFHDAANNFRAISQFLSDITGAFLSFGDNKGVKDFFKALAPAVDNIKKIGDASSGAGGSLGKLLTSVTGLALAFTSSGQMKVFLDTLTKISDVLITIFTSPFGKWILITFGGLFAIHRAAAFAYTGLAKIGKGVVGGPIAAFKALEKLKGGFSNLGNAFKIAKSDGFVAGLKSMGKASDSSKKKLEEQMTVDELKTKSLNALARAAERAAAALQLFKDAAGPLPGELKAIGKEAANGLTLGFEEGSQGFIDVMVALAREAVAAVKLELGIASPSKIFEEIGREAGQGYVLGLESQDGAAATAGAQLGASSATGAKEAAAGSAAAGEASALTAVAPVGAAGGAVAKEAAVAEKSLGKFATVGGKAGKGLGGLLGLFLPFSVGLEGVGAAIGAAIVPIIAIIAAIAAFVGMFILLYKQSPQFKKFIDGIVGKVKDLVHWFKDVVLPVIVDFAKWIGEKFVNLVVPPINAFFGLVNEALPKIGAAFGVAFHFIGQVWEHVLKPVFTALIKVVEFLWKFVIHPYLKLIQFQFKLIFGFIKLYWNTILHPVIKAIIAIIEFLWKNVFKPYFNLIGDIVKGAFKGIKLAWDNVLHPVIDAIITVVGKIKDAFQTVFDKVKTIWANFIGIFKTVKTDIGNIVDGVVSKFKDIGSAVAGAFKGLGKFAAAGLNSFINFINHNLIDKVNSVTTHFGFTIDQIPTISLAAGGKVKGPGGDREDKVLAALSNNEFVVNAKSAKAIGYDALNVANKTGQLPGGGLGWPHPHIPGVSVIKNLAGDTINGVKNVGETIAREGLGKALEAMVKGAEKLMGGPFPRGKGLNDLFYGILDKLASAVQDWGGDSGKVPKNAKGQSPTAAFFDTIIKSAGKWVFPVAGPYTYNSRYTYGKPDGQGGYHTGSDLDAAVGTPLVAMNSGRVRSVNNIGDQSYGRYVLIDYAGASTLYAHMNAFAAGLRAGMPVKGGTPIGQVGWYGNVFPKSPAGAHLHLEVAPPGGAFGSMSSTIDPAAWLRKLGFKLAGGGVVSPSDGGMLSVIGEAGKHERVEPLDREGFSKRDRAILDMIQQAMNKRKGDQFIVNPSRGMDEMELAAAVARRITFRGRTGG